MILVILGVCVLLIIAGIIYGAIRDSECLTPLFCGVGIFGFIVTAIVSICLIVGVSNLAVIDDKIAMYEEENSKIEMQIAETVKQYQEYESGIFTEVAPESSVTLVALYPELKADTLVQKQIEVYVANNEKIKKLKESDISGNVKRWWLYFGGKRSDSE